MLREEDLATWLKAQGVSVPLSYDTLPDAEPHTCVALSVTGGLGMTVENAFDRPTFSVMVRAANGKAARDLGLQVDHAILDPEPGFDMNGTYVADKGRFTGPPAFVAMDDRNRAIRSATYWMELVR